MKGAYWGRWLRRSSGSGGAGVEDTSRDSQKKKPAKQVHVQGACQLGLGYLEVTTPSPQNSAIIQILPSKQHLENSMC